MTTRGHCGTRLLGFETETGFLVTHSAVLTTGPQTKPGKVLTHAIASHFFLDRASLCSPNLPGTYYVDQADFDWKSSVFWSYGIKGTHHHALNTLFVKRKSIFHSCIYIFCRIVCFYQDYASCLLGKCSTTKLYFMFLNLGTRYH